MSTIEVGAQGESLACAYLEQHSYEIVERNWRCALGEIDIIAIDPDGVLVFCEVKCRSGEGFGSPLEAITYAKVRKLRQLVGHYLATHPSHPQQIRLDALGIVARRGYAPVFTHIEGIGA